MEVETDVGDEVYSDGVVARAAVESLWQARERLRAAFPPRFFFLAVGFFKPHLPWCAPKRYWRQLGKPQSNGTETKETALLGQALPFLRGGGGCFRVAGQPSRPARGSPAVAFRVRR